MIRAQGPLRALPTAELTWSDDGEPRSVTYDDWYFNSEQGDAESRQVFINGSDLQQRFTAHQRRTFVIGELGFGTGLNFLETWHTFNTSAPDGLRLHYWSLDRYPLTHAALQQSLGRWPQHNALACELLDAYPPSLPGVHRRILGGGRVILDLVWADASDALQEISELAMPLVDAWYLDGFAPPRNSAMWNVNLYRQMAGASRDAATIATYSAAGTVRRGLEEAGFSVRKRAGYGLKRENLQGNLAPAECRRTVPPTLTPWDLIDRRPSAAYERVVIIGAGLAGAHAASALARRGIAVTVLDAAAHAGRSSGNPQGVLFNRLSHERSILSEFSLLAFLFARERYRALFASGQLTEGLDGELSGCIQTGTPAGSRGSDDALSSALVGLQDIASPCDAENVDALLGVVCGTPGLTQPGAGWLSPPAVCKALLSEPGITLKEHCGPLQLSRGSDGLWEACSADGTLHAAAPVVVMATGTDSREFTKLQGAPLKVVRGQTTQIPAPEKSSLQMSFCHRGYVAPAMRGEHCIGATFNPGDESREIRIEDHRDNIRALSHALPGWSDYLATLNPETLQGRAELRCVSPDYLPLAGPVPDRDAFCERFEGLQWDAKQLIPEHGAYLPGLYLSTAYGSRGLSYAALGAELIASQICAEPIPLSRELQRAVAPARFLIRGLIRSTQGPKISTA